MLFVLLPLSRVLYFVIAELVSSFVSALQSIGRRITTNKCIMVLIIIVLLGIIGVIIYFAIPKPTPTPPTPNLTSIAQPALRVLRLWDLPERPPQ